MHRRVCVLLPPGDVGSIGHVHMLYLRVQLFLVRVGRLGLIYVPVIIVSGLVLPWLSAATFLVCLIIQQFRTV